jgi:hypothetical protein
METRLPDRIGLNDAVDAGFPDSKITQQARTDSPSVLPILEGRSPMHSGSRVADVPRISLQDATARVRIHRLGRPRVEVPASDVSSALATILGRRMAVERTRVHHRE